MTITIRRATVDDAAAFARIMGSPAVYPNLMQLPHTNEAIWRARLADLTAPGKPDLMLVAERVQHGQAEVVGSAGLHPASTLPRLRHVAMMGISVAPEAQRQGVGSALMQAVCDFADRWMQVRRIELEVYVDNAAAIALYRKFGFEPETTQRGYALRDGAYVDSLGMARSHPRPPTMPAPIVPRGPATPPASAVQRGTAGGSWSLRSFEASDAEAVAALLTRHGVVEEMSHTPWAPAEGVRERLAKPAPDCAIVALTQARVVGYAALTPFAALRRRHAAALTLGVAPEWQGRGVGAALLAALLEWADDWGGLLRLELAVGTGNAAALALCRKFGFEQEGTRRGAVLREGAFADLHAMARLHVRAPQADAPAQA